MLGIVTLPRSLNIEDAKDSEQQWLDIMHNSRLVSQGLSMATLRVPGAAGIVVLLCSAQSAPS